MKVLSAQQIKDADAHTIKSEPIASIDLMERASASCVDWIISTFPGASFCVICGEGNNGGDGLAIARMLLERSYSVSVLALHFSMNRSNDCAINFNRVLLGHPESLREISSAKDLNIEGEIIIDAIFGNGLSRPASGEFKSVIDQINALQKTVVAIDLPSGLPADSPNFVNSSVVKARFTLTFQQPKLALLLPENTPFVGDWVIRDIGLSHEFIERLETKYFVSTSENLANVLSARSSASHKGNFGHALIIAGSKGKIGAAVLALHGCLHSGVGLLTALVPECGYEVVQSTVPEAMVLTSGINDVRNEVPPLNYSAIGVGPGLGQTASTKTFIQTLIAKSTCPLIIDADALNCISEEPELLKQLPKGSVLTPHPKEFDRLFGNHPSTFERLQTLQQKAKEFNLIILLKGQYTAVGNAEGTIYFNITGNAGMATGGSGDVLTGIITSIVAQGVSSFDAARLGVYIHGLAADFALNEQSEESLSATDIIHSLGLAFKHYHE